MKFLISKKPMIIMLFFGTIVLAGTLRDIHSRSINKDRTLSQLAPVERGVASNEEAEQKVALMKVEMSRAGEINGNWEITRIISSSGDVTFDKIKNAEDAKKTVKIPMRLIRTSTVILNNDRELVYKISLLSNFGTIAIFKNMGDGYEILEARKIKPVKAKIEVAAGEVELVLERALNQAKSGKVLSGSAVEGGMILTKKSIEELSVMITNANGEIQQIQIASAQLMDGGSFKADVSGDEVSGVIFNNGKDGYRLSFVTGPLAGAMLNFVTREELSKIEMKNSESNDNYFEKEEQKIQEIAQAEVLEERKDIAENVESYEPVKVLSAEEVRQVAEEQGFSF